MATNSSQDEDKTKKPAKAAEPVKPSTAAAKPKAEAKTEPAPIEPTAAVITSGADSLAAEQPKRNLRKLLLLIGGGVLAGLLILLVIFGILIYKYNSDSKVVYAVSRAVPYPVERVNGGFVTYGDYLFELKSIKQYYASQKGPDGKPSVDFTTNEGKAKLEELKKQIMTQLKTDTVTRQLIKENKIQVTDKEVNEQIDQITQASGGTEKVKEVLNNYYGWTYNDFKDKVRFQVAKQKLEEKVTSDDGANAQAKAKADDLLKQIRGGADFAELAKKNSQDSSAANGGDLGFFGKGQMVQEFEAAAFALQPNQVSEVVKSKFGYHIIKVTEKKDDQVRASHILIKAIDFEQYLKDKTDQAKTTVYLKA